MSEDGKWITYRGRRIFIKDKSTNDYMNSFIRNKGKEKTYDGTLELKKDDYDFVNGKYQHIKTDTFYKTNNGEKIEFIDKKEYKKMIDDFYNSLNDDEKKALQIWVDDPNYMSSNPIFKYDKDYDKIMDNIFKNKAITLDKDTLLFRRASDDYLDLKNGVNHDYAMSTSAYDTMPKTMPSGIKFGEKELYIIAPKGTKVLPIEKVAVEHPSNDARDKRIYTKQHEMILPKNTNYEMIKDLSTYYEQSAKGNEVYGHPATEQRYVVKLTNKKYDKVKYEKPKYSYYNNGYETYIYKHKGKDIEIEEKYVGNRYSKGQPRSEAVKYKVWRLGFKGKEEYYDTYEEAVKSIEKNL